MATVDIQINVMVTKTNVVSTGKTVKVVTNTLITDSVEEEMVQKYIDTMTPAVSKTA
jgi:hypothetical protein